MFKKPDTLKLLRNIIIPSLIGLIFFIFTYSSIYKKADTTDEKFHLVRGIMLLHTGDLRINQHHPYLFNAIQAIPTLFDEDLKLPDLEGDNWKHAQKDSLAFELVDVNGGRERFTQEVLYAPRVLMTVISTLFILIFYTLIRKEFGFIVALISTIVLAASPTFIAHGNLVTTDVPAMITIFFATFALYKYLKNPTRLNLGFFVLFSFIAIFTKFNALFLSTIWLLVLFIQFARQDAKHGRLKQILYATLRCIGIVIIWTFLLTAFYKFEFATVNEMAYGNVWKEEQNAIEVNNMREAYGDIPANIHHAIYFDIPWPFPQFVSGFLDNALKHNLIGHKAFFLGEQGEGGWLHYFPVAFAIKESLSTVTLTIFSAIFAGIIFVRKVRWRKLDLPLLALILPQVVFIILLLTSNINLGLRHALPVYPFIGLLVGYSLDKLVQFKTYVAPIVVLLILFNYASLLSQFPYYIQYFNELTDGPKNGYLYLRDSSFEWGQTYILKQEFIRENEVVSVDQPELIVEDSFFITGKGDLLNRPSGLTPAMQSFRTLYEAGTVAPIAEVAHTQWVFFVDSEVYKLFQEGLSAVEQIEESRL